MKLKVGEVYRGVFAGKTESLKIVRIELSDSGRSTIRYRVLPRLSWLGWLSLYTYDTGEAFIDRLDNAEAPMRSVSEVEIRYR